MTAMSQRLKECATIAVRIFYTTVFLTAFMLITYPFFNVEIEFGLGLSIGYPIFNKVSLIKICYSTLLLLATALSLFVTLRKRSTALKIIIGTIIFLMASAISLPNMFVYRGSSCCSRLEWFAKRVNADAELYFSSPREINDIDILDIIDKIPPGYNVTISQVANDTVSICVRNKKCACSLFEEIKKQYKVKT